MADPSRRQGRFTASLRSGRERFSALRVLGVLARHPSLWPYAYRMIPPSWWRHWPPLPVPGRSYVRFRMETMYGLPAKGADTAESEVFNPEDLVTYLEWCKRYHRGSR